jgi:RNA polymerase sigma factor (TIGR02999 family)
MASGDITQLLEQWREGDGAAFDQLAPAVYDHLRRVAAGYLNRERPGGTLQATSLVHEVFLRLMHNQNVSYTSREHFFTFAATLMRRILVDHARQFLAVKRGEGTLPIALAPELAWVDANSPEFLDLDIALSELAKIDPEKVRTIEIRFFLGATAVETAELLEKSRSAVDRDVRFSLSWLHQRLRGDGVTQKSPV